MRLRRPDSIKEGNMTQDNKSKGDASPSPSAPERVDPHAMLAALRRMRISGSTEESESPRGAILGSSDSDAGDDDG